MFIKITATNRQFTLKSTHCIRWNDSSCAVILYFNFKFNREKNGYYDKKIKSSCKKIAVYVVINVR